VSWGGEVELRGSAEPPFGVPPPPPPGGRDDPINEAGIKYYSDVIDLLLSKGIEPYVTIFHWDLPSALEERYGGWTNFEEITKDFVRYSRVLFERFGDRVKNWITLNEVRVVARPCPWLTGTSR
jgi:beta-glucosidase